MPRIVLLFLCAGVVGVLPIGRARVGAQRTTGGAGPSAPTLGLEHGTLDFDTPAFALKLIKDSQTMAALQPKGAKGRDANTSFDFTPADQLPARRSLQSPG